MTRREFDEIGSFGELQDVCRDYGCDYMDDYMDDESMDTQICESITDALEHKVWYEVKELLDGIEFYGEGWYRRDGEWDWEYVSDDSLDDLKEEVREWMENHDCFEDDEDDDYEEPEYYATRRDEYPEYPLRRNSEPEEPCDEVENDMPVQMLFSVCNSRLQKLTPKKEEEWIIPF